MKKTILKYLVVAALFLMEGGDVLSQATLRGRVVDAVGSPVPYANIVVSDYQPLTGTAADDRGRFSFTVPSDTSVILRVTAVGWDNLMVPVRLHKGGRLDTTFVFKKKAVLDEVTVSGEKNNTTSFTKIEVERLESLPGPTGGVEALIKTLPDVNSNNELSSQYSVRGGSFDENLVYVNGVEVYRPMLIRSGQQEGMSIINPELVDHLLFSPGGFESSFGDRMSSVLDIIYARPTEFKAKASASLLGATASVQGLLGRESQFSYAMGFRHHSNSYLFRSLDTKGAYTTRYTDFQAVLGYRVSDRLDLSLLGIFSRNVYGLIPESQTTLTGGFFETMEFKGYFDGQEIDRYRTALGAFTLDFHPNPDFQLKWITSLQHNVEREIYDIQCQYWLYEVNVGNTTGDSLFERGVGTYLEHARNYLSTEVYSTELKASRFVSLGQWDLGLRLQREQVDDRVREWRWVDSAGYAIPIARYVTPGDSSNQPANPLLQNFCTAHNVVAANRAMAYVQRSVNLLTKKDEEVRILLGLRGHLYTTTFDTASGVSPVTVGPQLLVSPRLSVKYKPRSKRDLFYRFNAGVYHQPPFYREYRNDDGTLCFDVASAHSYQVMGTAGWNIKIRKKPFFLTTDIYYKYITDLVPYRIDNLRVRYDANNDAEAYATGVSMLLSGEFVEGLESWASLSLMQTQEDILTDTLGWLARPTDQRFSVKLYLQDYVPKFPFWRMGLTLIYGSGLPYTSPRQKDRSHTNRMPAYYRIDWSNTVELSKFERLKRTRFFQVVDDVMLTFEVFNLFDYHNVVSYTWVADYTNVPYHIPNYLTGRQLNLKLTVTF